MKKINMYMSFRWYSENNPIGLKYIKQIPKIKSMVISLHDKPKGSI